MHEQAGRGGPGRSRPGSNRRTGSPGRAELQVAAGHLHVRLGQLQRPVQQAGRQAGGAVVLEPRGQPVAVERPEGGVLLQEVLGLPARGQARRRRRELSGGATEWLRRAGQGAQTLTSMSCCSCALICWAFSLSCAARQARPVRCRRGWPCFCRLACPGAHCLPQSLLLFSRGCRSLRLHKEGHPVGSQPMGSQASERGTTHHFCWLDGSTIHFR